MKILLRHWRKLQNFQAPIEIFVRHGAAMAQKKTLGTVRAWKFGRSRSGSGPVLVLV